MAEVTLTISAEDGASGVLAKVAQGLDTLSKGSTTAGAASRKAGQEAMEGGRGFTQFAEKLNAATASVKDLLTPTNLLTSVVGIGLVASLRHAISEAGQYALEMQRLRLVTGATLPEIGELQDAASKLGVGTGTLQRAFFFLSSEIESGGRNLAKFGISTRDASGNQHSMMDIISRVSEKFKEMSTSTERAVAARKLFTRSGASMLPLFEMEQKQIEELGESGREFNKQFGEEGVKTNILLKGAVDETREAMMRLHITLVSDIRPVIKYIADVFAHTVDVFWEIPKPIRVIGEVAVGMGIAVIGGTLAVRGLVAAFRTLGITTIISDFAKLIGAGKQVATTAVLMSDGYRHLAESAAGSSIAIRALQFAMASLPLAILIAVVLDVGGVRTKMEESGKAFGQMIGQQIRSMAGLPPIEIDTKPRGFQSWSDFWQRTKELFGIKKDTFPDEGSRAAAREGAETGDREQTLAELQIEMGLKNRLLQTEMALIKATKDSVTAELNASKVRQATAVDEINLELKKLSDSTDADASILAERVKLEQAKTNIIKTGEAERARILGQQAAARLQQATAIEQQYRGVRLSALELEQTIALNGLEIAKTTNRQMLEDSKITQDEMVQREVQFLQEELDLRLKYLQATGQASEQRAMEDKRLIEAQAKATGEAAKDTALKINKIDADLAAARIDNEAKVGQTHIDVEGKIRAALRLTEAQKNKMAEEDRRRVEAARVQKALFDPFGLEGFIKAYEEKKDAVDKLINSARSEVSLEQERLDLLVALKRLDPVDLHMQMNRELQRQIGFLEEGKRLYAAQPELVKQIDMEILRLTDRIYTMRDALADAFGGISDILSILGIKVGKFILMLQQLPRVMGGFEKIGKGFAGIISLLSAPSSAAAGQGGGRGLFSMLDNLSSLVGMGGGNPAALALQWGAAPAGSSTTLGAPMMAGQASGMIANMVGMLGAAAAMLGPTGVGAVLLPVAMMIGHKIGSALFPGNKAAAQGGQWGGIFGPAGSVVGSIIGSLFGSKPKAKLKANILPFDLEQLTKGALRDLDTSINGTGVGAIGVNIKGNVYKRSKEHRLEEQFAQALNDLFIDIVKGMKTLIPELPKMVGAELNAALESLSETGLQFEKFSKSGSKSKKKLKKHLENLPNAMIEAVVEELGFGKLDLKMMGGGDAAKGFEGLLGALGGLSAVLKRATGSADSFTGTLAEFTDNAITFFEGFRRGGETFAETVERVNHGFASLFGIMDQLDMEIGTSSAAGFQGLVDVYQRSVQRIQELADAGMVAVESGASPDEIAAAAQALREAMQVSQDVLQRIAAGLQALNAAVVTGVDLYADLEIRIRALDGAATALDELIDGAYRLAVSTHNIGAQISIFESVLKVVGSDFTSFTAALPRMAGAFNELMAAIRNTESNTEAVTQLQALAQAVTNGAQAAYQGIANGASRARDSAQTAADARIQALEAERDAIQDVAQEQRDANQAQLDAIREWKGIVESTKAQLVDLFNLLAPTHPETSFNEVLAQFRSAVGGFGPGSTPESALQIQDLAKQVLQLAQGVPGMDLPSLAFQALAAEVKTALEAVQTVAENQPSETDLLGQIATSTTDNSARLAEIDAAIKAEQTGLQQALQSISAQEQEQIAFVNAQQVAAMNEIRLHLGARLMGLQAEQEAARAILTQITGNLSFEQFIAQKQADSVIMLGEIRDVLKNYLGSIIQGLGYTIPSAASGMAYVPADGPVYLHRGERVVTARENQRNLGNSPGVSVVVNLTANSGASAKKLVDELEEELVERIKYGPLNAAIKGVRS